MKRCCGLVGLVMGHKFKPMVLSTQFIGRAEAVVICERCGSIADITPLAERRERDELNKIFGGSE